MRNVRGEASARRVAEIAGRRGLAAVNCDLRFGESTREQQLLIVGAEFRIQRAALACIAQIGLCILLAQPVVVAIVVGLEMIRVDDQAELVAGEIEAGAVIAGCVAAIPGARVAAFRVT